MASCTPVTSFRGGFKIRMYLRLPITACYQTWAIRSMLQQGYDWLLALQGPWMHIISGHKNIGDPHVTLELTAFENHAHKSLD